MKVLIIGVVVVLLLLVGLSVYVRTAILSTDPLRFVTRSRVMGFPDITQVFVRDGVLTIHAHLVFGSSDLGVNKARVLAWLDQLGPL